MFASMSDQPPAAASVRRVLDVRGLRVRLRNDADELVVVNSVSFGIDQGETLALVGESGSGKSMSALSILRLVRAAGHAATMQTEGKILFRDAAGVETDLLALPIASMRAIRGRAIGMIFQEPMTALNPVMRVGEQIVEGILAHEAVGRAAAAARALQMLRMVGMADVRAKSRAYPHELSGGMRQRAMIAIALASRPRLLIADEPTTALDVTIQAQVVDLIRQLQREFGMAVLFITHDLGLVAHVADRVAVMYAGRIVEEAPVNDFFASPAHPYSAGLLGSMPTVDPARPAQMVRPIPGAVPQLAHLPGGCAFHPRCAFAEPDVCARRVPVLESLGSARAAACWHPIRAGSVLR